MPHDANARRLAAAVPLVLFGEHGRTVEGYMPAEEDLAAAAPASANGVTRHARNQTGIVGISVGQDRARGHTYYWVNLGSSSRRFNITLLGREEALRRAIALRRAHLEKLALANAAIIAARLQAAKRGAA
jgi:hypothetical protein